MPKAERGTPKDLANRMKSKGLQKLAFYCQVCERQMRDQNGFRQHCASEPHVRMMLSVGNNAGRVIGEYSRQFKHDFLQLLRTAHGEKRVHANHFYQEYIQNKSHIHMNGTHWKTLTEFVTGLGREGICRVEADEKGFYISYIDKSSGALSRAAALRRREKQEKTDEERANLLIAEQVERANQEAASKVVEPETEESVASTILDKKPEERIKLSFGKPSSTSLTASETMARKPSIFAQQNKASAARTTPTLTQVPKRPMSNAEQIVLAERERQRRLEGFKSNEAHRQQRSAV